MRSQSVTFMNQPSQPAGNPVSSVVIVTSPKAGSGVGREQLPRLVERLTAAGVTVHTTPSIEVMRQHLTDARLDSGHLPVIVAAGGDGTLSLIADNVPSAIPIVPMPLGTENLLARHFGHKVDAAAVADTIQHGSSYWLDAGQANGKLFLVMATCGFDAEVVRAMHLTRRGHIRRYHYAGPIMRALRHYRFPSIQAHLSGQDRETISCGWAMIFNLPCYGGHLKINRRAVGNDGLLNLMAFQRGSIASGFKYLAGIATRQHHRFRDVREKRATTIELTADSRVPYQLDGDYGGRLPLHIETLPGRVHLLLPRDQHGQ